MEHLGDCAHQKGLGHSWNALNQGMISGDNRDQRFLHHLLLADNDLAGFLSRLGQDSF